MTTRVIFSGLLLLLSACKPDPGDTAPPADSGEIPEIDADGDGFGPNDCDDEDATMSPLAPEICDGKDNDCDGETDEDDALDAATFFADADGDGFGDILSASVACTQPDGTVSND